VIWGCYGTRGHRQCHQSIELIRLPIHLIQKLYVNFVMFSRYSELLVEIANFSNGPRPLRANDDDDDDDDVYLVPHYG